jgi:ATP phosphoribosyltransferase regulatory subunit
MSDDARRALLPAGFADLLPLEASHEAAIVERLMAAYGAQGYERVKPPLVEFEESLLTGEGAAMAPHSFRLMDPVSQRMLAIRPDMTLQVARIAAVRLAKAPRPLRLCYAGQVLRVKGDALRTARQFGQLGCELIGADAAAADVEILRLAAESLLDIGARGLSVDLSLPALVAAILETAGLPTESHQRLREALDRKDAAAVARLGGNAATILVTMLRESGEATRALAALDRVAVPERARGEVARLREVIAALGHAQRDLPVTIDLVESRGFDYETGLRFAIFARDVRGELGRGGRYFAGGGFASHAEPAAGFTLYTDTVIQALAAPEPPRRIYVPYSFGASASSSLRAQGWTTLVGLAAESDERKAARDLGCTHLFTGNIEAIG